MDELGDRSQDGLPADGTQPEFSRRDFLKKAAGVALAVPAAGALVGSAAAAPRIRVGNLAQPFAGVTLQFAKAPHGNDWRPSGGGSSGAVTSAPRRDTRSW